MKEEELEKAIVRFDRRYKTFLSEGLCDDKAYRLAEQMHERDFDPQDDRRVCFECDNYVGKVCIKILHKNRPSMPLRFQLQRCDYFKLKGTK